jgi:hypothetical protein
MGSISEPHYILVDREFKRWNWILRWDSKLQTKIRQPINALG